jgi:hypothetical protein
MQAIESREIAWSHINVPWKLCIQKDIQHRVRFQRYRPPIWPFLALLLSDGAGCSDDLVIDPK